MLLGLDRGWPPEAASPDVGVPESTTTHLTYQLAVAPKAASNPGPFGLHVCREDDDQVSPFCWPGPELPAKLLCPRRLLSHVSQPNLPVLRYACAAKELQQRTYESTYVPSNANMLLGEVLRTGMDSFARPAKSTHTISHVAVPTQNLRGCDTNCMVNLAISTG